VNTTSNGCTFQLVLEYISDDDRCLIFRLAFESCTDRLLLPYPEVTGLKFTTPAGEKLAEWKTQFLVSAPVDEFVLNRDSRIAFDLKAHINTDSDEKHRWTARIGSGEINAHYMFEVQPDIKRYDFLAKGSRFAAITKPWSGSLKSNAVQFSIPTSPSKRK
jgi:hypothetical protein